MRVSDGVNQTAALPTITTGATLSGGQDQAGASDSMNSTTVQQPQPQVYYVPQIYSYPTPGAYSYVEPTGDQASAVQSSQSLVPSHQNSQTSLYQIPQMTGTQIPVSSIPAGTVIYQMAPPQSPMPSSQIIYQMPTTPQPNYQTVMYQIPNIQYTQNLDNSSQIPKQDCKQCVSIMIIPKPNVTLK